jgi:F0F1-type ATP synthase membrane subunit c/vacuolar-type H+-ATPase subunit K
MVFVKAVKCLAFAIALTPLVGCAIGLGLIFGSLLRAAAYAPDYEEILFSHAMLGFALVESFMIIALAVIGMIYTY